MTETRYFWVSSPQWTPTPHGHCRVRRVRHLHRWPASEIQRLSHHPDPALSSGRVSYFRAQFFTVRQRQVNSLHIYCLIVTTCPRLTFLTGLQSTICNTS